MDDKLIDTIGQAVVLSAITAASYWYWQKYVMPPRIPPLPPDHPPKPKNDE
ncbi:MAG: hypothetical protein NT013_19990 [Planctomycetia bacterium]|nr:hypothetical protein [Planctomycetia bacterium]